MIVSLVTWRVTGVCLDKGSERYTALETRDYNLTIDATLALLTSGKWYDIRTEKVESTE